ncbi:VQ domain-containing protein [Heracleum sosnowskyi]|uniref:VQ domain-containing protein n=1 Tax=Heracleum sosnowskyi TaxID=360622 RepID=A0AAD8IMX3_9APIA|nr:VQ domain-containing protein [Heracleum sosnowskyi]
MVKKFITSQATVDDHELLVKNISKKSSDKKNNLQSAYQVHILKDPSTFKNLVQELTGNGNLGSASSACTSPLVSSPPCAITSKPIDYEQVQVPVLQSNMVDNTEEYGFQESSPELSFDSSDLISIPVMSDSSQETNDYMPTTLLSKEYDLQSTWDMVTFPLQYEEMGSWFSEMDALVYCNYDSYALQPVMPPEVCVFDYDLSAIM